MKSLETKLKNVTFISKRSKPKPSIVYNTYWKFAAERQRIFYDRISNKQYPWSADIILNNYKFTNVYRATDRVSQYLIKNIINNGSQSENELFFRIILFKIFNRIETWEYLEKSIGDISLKSYSYQKFDKILSELVKNNIPIYSAAYIMASGKSYFGKERKYQNHLRLIEMMLREEVPRKLQECKTMLNAYNILLSYPTIGEFLAYQYITDINYSELTNYSEMEFVKAGPGAKDGILKCFSSFGDYSFEDIIRMITENQEVEFERLRLSFRGLWGRKLQLIDCQNIFCEVDKYARLVYPRIKGYSNRIRIKQKYIYSKKESIDFCFPRKWNIDID
ncbi:nucleotide kinase domain-containing protein [Leptospira santarosai]|nr:nucleotide kinase domain-containing protein [Leptospira santarosai]MDI7230509.1 putative DNA base hypermodification protein [Leptospira santarosai]